MQAGDAEALRSAVEQYDDFNWMNRNNVPDKELMETIENWLEINRPHLVQEMNLRDVNGNLLPGLPQELVDWRPTVRRSATGWARRWLTTSRSKPCGG